MSTEKCEQVIKDILTSHLHFTDPKCLESALQFVYLEGIKVGLDYAKQEYSSVIEKKEPCERCGGTGAIDAPFSGSNPCCPDCDGDVLFNPALRDALLDQDKEKDNG